jgi:hypothetical protein
MPPNTLRKFLQLICWNFTKADPSCHTLIENTSSSIKYVICERGIHQEPYLALAHVGVLMWILWYVRRKDEGITRMKSLPKEEQRVDSKS